SHQRAFVRFYPVGTPAANMDGRTALAKLRLRCVAPNTSPNWTDCAASPSCSCSLGTADCFCMRRSSAGRARLSRPATLGWTSFAGVLSMLFVRESLALPLVQLGTPYKMSSLAAGAVMAFWEQRVRARPRAMIAIACVGVPLAIWLIGAKDFHGWKIWGAYLR